MVDFRNRMKSEILTCLEEPAPMNKRPDSPKLKYSSKDRVNPKDFDEFSFKKDPLVSK